MIRNSITLLQYAGYLFVIGLASVLYNAATGEAGFNKHGLSGLYACGGSAVLAAIFGVLTGKSKEWAAWAGLILAFLLLSFGGYKVFDMLRNIDAHTVDLIKKRAEEGLTLTDEAARKAIYYRAGIFGALFAFSLHAFLKLGTALRAGKTA
jgi:hypothetical protein